MQDLLQDGKVVMSWKMHEVVMKMQNYYKIIVTIQSHLDFATLHLDVDSRQIDLQEKVLVYASITHIFSVNLLGSE